MHEDGRWGFTVHKINATSHRGHETKYYAVMNVTSGYHQAPLYKDAMPMTAFVTSKGVFEWVRVSMGLKGAPSYF